MDRPVPKQIIYSLKEKNESEISPIWQILQVFFYACCQFLGFFICWLFTQVLNLTKSHCVLYAEVELTNESFGYVGGVNVSCSIGIYQPLLRWNCCDVILVLAVLISTIASFLLVMFIYCGRGGSGKPGMPDAWRIVWPAIFINAICFSLVLFSAAAFTNGIISFKENLQEIWALNVTDFDLGEIDCLQMDNRVVGKQLTSGLYLLKEFMFLWVSFWALNLFWVLLRCAFNIDFQLVRTTVYQFPTGKKLVRRPMISLTEDENRESLGSQRKSVKFSLMDSSEILNEIVDTVVKQKSS